MRPQTPPRPAFLSSHLDKVLLPADCDDFDASLWGTPGPTSGLVLAHDPVTSITAVMWEARAGVGRSPEDFMFQLVEGEFENLRYQFGTSSSWGGRRHRPFAFTEHGVAMLSSVLRSERAVQVNIEIMRAFVRLREVLQANLDLARKLDALEKKYDGQFRVVFEAIRALMTPPEQPRKQIGFRPGANRDPG